VDCAEEWKKEENRPTVEMAKHLEKLFSESGAIDDLRVRYENDIIFGNTRATTTYFMFRQQGREFRLIILVNPDQLLE